MPARFSMLGLAIASLVLPAADLAAQAPPAFPPPARALPVASEPREWHVLTFQMSDVTCDNGTRIAPAHLAVPDPQPQIRARGAPGEIGVITVSFALDAEGRPIDITGTIAPQFRLQARDIMPSLRASRFAVDGARTGCTIRYTPEIRSMDEAPLEAIARFGVAQRLRMPKEAFTRIAPGDCRESPRAAPLTRSYPDFRKLTRREGEHHWAYVTYDLDADGVPVNLAVPLTSGYPELEAEARRAVAAGRYAGGPRTGCVQAWWTGPDAIAAPPIPPKDETRGNAACEIKDRWDREPRLVFPPNYRQRAIEGWAILRFDVAPWGEIGGIEVLEAQPSSEFGEAAVNVIRGARYKPIDSGLKGCVDRVIFRMKSEPDQGDGDTALMPELD